MSTFAPPSWVDDRELYPLHEEEDVPEIIGHESEVRNLRDVLGYRFRDGLVTGNVCTYWSPGDFHLYYAPDAFVTDGQPAEPEPRVYHIWQDAPIVFVAEVDSRSLTEAQWEHNFRICELVLCVPELLDFDPEDLLLRMWRLGPAGYEPVKPEGNGRLRSQELALEFGIDADGRLRAYTLDGEVLRIYEEAEREGEEAEHARREAEHARREAEHARREAEREREEAVHARREAEHARETAEARAAEEARQRVELERQLAERRAELHRRGDAGGSGGTTGAEPSSC